ncbi:hypothetical protein F2Q69_00020642 [Brassica cretica]|uniref:Uncharacterized protein n=1 Tax=Brassica cretica TaxID=69181 RepID=A0A8S9QJU5_BRACR|nr:hypothetical protein F2Q69_00020642 [Brassica cretica]
MTDITVKVNCYHSGKFKTVDGKLIADGKVEVVEVDGVTIFEGVVFQMVHKKELGNMWYKLPYEDLEDRKFLSDNIDQGKKKLATWGCWMREIDFYIEKTSEDERINEEEKPDLQDERMNLGRELRRGRSCLLPIGSRVETDACSRGREMRLRRTRAVGRTSEAELDWSLQARTQARTILGSSGLGFQKIKTAPSIISASVGAFEIGLMRTVFADGFVLSRASI